MQIGILRVDITLFFLTFVCLERTVFFPNWFLLDFVFTSELLTILGVKSTQFLVTYFVLNNCIYLSLCKMRTLWFQECKISTVLHPLNHSDSHLLNIFQFSNLLLGGGGGWTYLRAVLTWRYLKCWTRGKNHFPCYAGYSYCGHQACR